MRDVAEYEPHDAASEEPADLGSGRVNPTFQSIVELRYSRRATMFGGMSAAGAAVFGLAACDSGGGSNPIALPTPTVALGGAVATTAGKLVTLTGRADNAGGVGSGVLWTQVSGPAVSLSGATTPTATFVAPAVAASAPLVFRFTAMNGLGQMASGDSTVTVGPAILDFAAVPKTLNDIVTVPAGYTVSVLYRLGDPINATTAAYANNGTDVSLAARAGDHHDGLYYFGLAATGSGRDDANSERGLVAMNHENITQRYLHPNGATSVGGARPEAEARKEMEAHGVSVIEVNRSGGGWSYVLNSTLNRRVTPFTEMQFSGPAAGSALLRTAFSPTGQRGRGTINNCGNGYTPWGNYLTCEENYAGYFRRSATDNTARGGATAKSVISLTRNGLAQGAAGGYGWAGVSAATPGDTSFSRWNASVATGAPADGSGDFRNEPNQFGWIVEIDPYDPASTPRKRTALGRFAHEGAWPSLLLAGRRPAIYMGDDNRGDYIYKFVSAQPWVPADAQAANRLAIGDKYLDAGTLYVAVFNADGSGEWRPLVFGQGPLTAANAAYPFADQADVLINARLAGDALGATRMDRPEWGAVNPVTGEVYFTLTNTNTAARPITATDAANPRIYADVKLPQGDLVNVDPPAPPVRTVGNPNGHIIRLREAGDSSEATTFRWDIYLFGAGADLDPANINISGLDAGNDFSSPDGLWFSRPTGVSGRVNPLLWIQTDDGAYTDVTNCMMLAAMPGVTGDGGARTITNTLDGVSRQQATIVGRAASGMNLKRFLVGPKECEITGIDSTPDGRTLFVNIQHPGEDTSTGFPNTFPSNWPASQTNPAAVSRPRSSTIVITKNDGGVVGL